MRKKGISVICSDADMPDCFTQMYIYGATATIALHEANTLLPIPMRSVFILYEMIRYVNNYFKIVTNILMCRSAGHKDKPGSHRLPGLSSAHQYLRLRAASAFFLRFTLGFS